MIARARLRKGNTNSAKGAGRLLAQALTTARTAGVKGQILCRADSAYYGWAFVGAAPTATTPHEKREITALKSTSVDQG